MKYKFGDCIKVTSGFYEGCEGYIEKYMIGLKDEPILYLAKVEKTRKGIGWSLYGIETRAELLETEFIKDERYT